MSKIAVVGCQGSGKTVFMAALADYYKPNQRPNQLCCMTPEDANANRFSEMMTHQMRDLHEWPKATNDQRTMSYKWAMRYDSEIMAQIEMLDFGGEVYRAAFRDTEGTPRNQEAVSQLLAYLNDADFVVVLVSLAELSRDINRTASESDVVADTESKWVTRGLLDLLKRQRSDDAAVIVALSQADRPEHIRLLENHGGPRGVFEKAWPYVSAVYPNVKVVSVASVSNTTIDNRPADGFKTDGVLSVMKEFNQHEFGDCDGVSQRLSDSGNDLCQMAQIEDPSEFSGKLEMFESFLQKLYQRTAIVAELYAEEFQRYESIRAAGHEFANVVMDVEKRPIESQTSSTFWREQEQMYPMFSGTIKSFERLYQRKAEQLKEAARKREEAAKQAEAERRQQLLKAEQERQQRIRLEAEERARLQHEQEMAAKRAEIEKQKRLDELKVKQEEERLADARAVREQQIRHDKAGVFARRMMMVSVILVIVLATATVLVTRRWKILAEERAVENQHARMAQEEAERQNRAAQAEKDRLDRIAKDAQAEKDRKLRTEQEDRRRRDILDQEEKNRVAQEKENQLRRQTEERKATENRKAREAELKARETELELKKLEVKRLAMESAERERNAALAREEQAKKDREAREAAAKAAKERTEIQNEISELIEEMKQSASNDDLPHLRSQLVRLNRFELSTNQKSIVKVCELFCQHLEKAKNDNADSQCWIALQHAEQKTFVRQDYSVARKWYEKAASCGSAKAMYQLAIWAEEGIGMTKDDATAVKWYKKACDAGSGDAAYWLGVYYSRGEKGLERSRQKAYEMFVEAKRMGTSYKNIDNWIELVAPSNKDPSGKATSDLEDLLNGI